VSCSFERLFQSHIEEFDATTPLTDGRGQPGWRQCKANHASLTAAPKPGPGDPLLHVACFWAREQAWRTRSCYRFRAVPSNQPRIFDVLLGDLSCQSTVCRSQALVRDKAARNRRADVCLSAKVTRQWQWARTWCDRFVKTSVSCVYWRSSRTRVKLSCGETRALAAVQRHRYAWN